MNARAGWVASALAVAASVCSCGEAAEQMPVRRIVFDVLAQEDYEVLAERPAAAPSVGVITPSINALDDAGDRVALVLPPPAEAQIRIPADATGELVLRASAGVDLSLARALVRAQHSAVIGFEVDLNGQTVFQHETEVAPQRARDTHVNPHAGTQPNRWQTVGQGRGLRVRAGDVVTLRTTLPQGEIEGVTPDKLRAGFGQLVVERTDLIARSSATPARPNVVLIVMDTLRADRTSAFGYERKTTPHLERLAARGIAFDAAYASSSWTWPSTASLLTGLEPAEHGVEDYRSCTLASDLETLAESLQARGTTTAAFSGNPLIAPARNFDQGFELFDFADELRMSATLVPTALRWLEENAQHRFFLYLHLVDPHSPHTPRADDLERFSGEREPRYRPDLLDQLGAQLFESPKGAALDSEDRRRWLSDAYDASVATGDHWLGQVLETLEHLGLNENTVIAFTSDHGEELFDRGLLGHSHSLHRELVHVPLVLAGPNVSAGVRVTQAVNNRHLGPTLAALAGSAMPRARDALRLDQPAQLSAAPVFTSTRKGYWNGLQRQSLSGVRADSFVFIQNDESDAPPQLFDLSHDADERRNIAPQDPQRTTALRTLLTERTRELRARRPAGLGRAGASTLKVLEGMGYAGAESDEDED